MSANILASRGEQLDLTAYYTHIRHQADPMASGWITSNAYNVVNWEVVIDQPSSTWAYSLLKILSLGSTFRVTSLAAGIFGVTQESLSEGSDSLAFPGLDIILYISLRKPAAFVEYLAAGEWITSEKFTGSHAENPRAQIAKLSHNTTRVGPSLNILHRVESILTAAWNGERHNSVWMVCTSCPAQLAVIFSAGPGCVFIRGLTAHLFYDQSLLRFVQIVKRRFSGVFSYSYYQRSHPVSRQVHWRYQDSAVWSIIGTGRQVLVRSRSQSRPDSRSTAITYPNYKSKERELRGFGHQKVPASAWLKD